jgi:essential nuclear protein 1
MPGTNATGEGGDAKPRLPVLWHQCLKEFAKTYKNDITEDQREALLDILLIHWHPGIGPDTRKELTAGRDRAAARMPQEVGLDGDDTMLIDS